MILLIVLSFRLLVGVVYVQEIGILPGETLTQDKERPLHITASVRDDDPPTTPILISPENDSTLTTNKPTFVWKESTDAFSQIDHYVPYIDGKIFFDNIPTTDTENAQYLLEYDGTAFHYSITPKDGISEGTHTWKIVAFDSYTNSSTSVTWSFTIDTQSPTFVITTIADETVHISTTELNSQ